MGEQTTSPPDVKKIPEHTKIDSGGLSLNEHGRTRQIHIEAPLPKPPKVTVTISSFVGMQDLTVNCFPLSKFCTCPNFI